MLNVTFNVFQTYYLVFIMNNLSAGLIRLVGLAAMFKISFNLENNYNESGLSEI